MPFWGTPIFTHRYMFEANAPMPCTPTDESLDLSFTSPQGRIAAVGDR